MEGKVSPATVRRLVNVIERQVRDCVVPIVTKVAVRGNPFLVLISCMLSLRTRDEVTAQASARLFTRARTARALAGLQPRTVEKTIYPVGFYRTKARAVIAASRIIAGDFQGKVPRTREALMSLPGVGRKTANLVLGLGFGIPAICVDTHVHRIPNRLGWIRTKDPLASELSLERIVPRDLWIKLNTILVTFGQNICEPVSPRCSVCMVRRSCRRVGVRASR